MYLPSILGRSLKRKECGGINSIKRSGLGRDAEGITLKKSSANILKKLA